MSELSRGAQDVVAEMRDVLAIKTETGEVPPQETEATGEPTSEQLEILPKAEPQRPVWRSDHEAKANQAILAKNQAATELQGAIAAMNSNDMRSLEQTDPGRAALARQKLQEKIGALQGVLQQADQVYAGSYQAHVSDEIREVQRLVPEWRDKTTMKREAGEITRWLKQSGYGDQEIGNVLTAGSLVKLRRLWQMDTGSEPAPRATGRVRRPKRAEFARGSGATIEKLRSIVGRK